MYALNLTHSPENPEFWESADPLIIGAGNTGGALRISTNRHPGVADSIEHDNDSGVTRQASESNRVWLTDIKGGNQKTPMRGMETGNTAMV